VSTVRYSFHVKRAAAGAPKRLQPGKAQPVAEKVPRIARLLALAHKFQGMLDRGEVASMADLARGRPWGAWLRSSRLWRDSYQGG
jgi:hypothetical protein